MFQPYVEFLKPHRAVGNEKNGDSVEKMIKGCREPDKEQRQ